MHANEVSPNLALYVASPANLSATSSPCENPRSPVVSSAPRTTPDKRPSQAGLHHSFVPSHPLAEELAPHPSTTWRGHLNASELEDTPLMTADRQGLPRGASNPSASVGVPLRDGDGDDARGGFTITLDDVSLNITQLNLFRRKKVVLSHVRMHLKPGAVCGVLSTPILHARCLLAALAGAEKHAEGFLMANEVPMTSTLYRRHVAFITTVSGCAPDLTVRENLLFSVCMRVSTPDANSYVSYAADITELTDVLDVVTRHLTSAQQYQLALGMELVLDPAVVLLDNVARYVNLADTLTFVRMLHKITSNGRRTVVLSATDVHWSIYKVLTDLVLISSEGRVLFAGGRAEVIPFFEHDLGILNVSEEMVGDMLAQMEDSQSVAHTAMLFGSSSASQALQERIAEHKRKVSEGGFDQSHDVLPVAPSYWQQLRLLSWSMIKCHFLSIKYLFPWAMLFAIFLFLAILLAISSEAQTKIQSRRGVIFFLLSCSMQINFVFLATEVHEYFSFVHLRNNHYFTVSQYFMVTVLRLLIPRVLFAVAGTLCALIALQSGLSMVILMGLTSFAHASVTLLVGYWYPDIDVLWTTGHCYYGYCVVLSGFIIILKNIPSFFQYLSLLRYGYAGLVASELRNSERWCRSVTNSTESCYSASDYLELEGFTKDSWAWSSVTLLAFTMVTLAAVAVSMYVTWIPRGFT